MPELPEVETVARQLAPYLVGRKLKTLDVFDQKLSHFKRAEQKILKRSVCEVKRFGKQILIRFAGEEDVLLIHLRMTGNLIWSEAKNQQQSRYWKNQEFSSATPRVSLRFDRGQLDFFDTRRFGTVELVKQQQLENVSWVDPVSKAFTPEIFLDFFKNRKQCVKQFLLRQDLIVGIGNIYASEILFLAKINPQKNISRLSKAEQERLFLAIPKILKQAIKNNGTTFSDFKDASGKSGGFQNLLKVYDREAEPCLECETLIKRITQNGRSSYYCSRCQKE